MSHGVATPSFGVELGGPATDVAEMRDLIDLIRQAVELPSVRCMKSLMGLYDGDTRDKMIHGGSLRGVLVQWIDELGERSGKAEGEGG